MAKNGRLMEPEDESIRNFLRESSVNKYVFEDSCAVIISEGIITYVNKNVCKTSKYNKEELIGHDFLVVYSGFHNAEIARELWATISMTKIWQGEIQNQAKDGTYYWLDATILPYVQEAGAVLKFLVIGADITGQKNAENLDVIYKKLASQNIENEKYAEELTIANTELVLQQNEKQKRAAELIIADKERVFQNKEKEKRAVELVIADKELVFQKVEKGKRAAELIIANKELVFQNAEKEKRAAELIIANKELRFQNKEKEKRAAELIIANKELVFQNKEKEKRAGELIIANKELAFQNSEKEKRAAEHIVANKELAFQNKEKEKRAAELIVANKELVFQNKEKEKRAAELIIANKELVFQNEEKGKRAAELIIANKELLFQNNEKGKRAAELIIANQELAYQNEEKEKRARELSKANRQLKKAEDDIRQLNEELEEKVLERTAQLESANKELESFSYTVSHDLRAPLRAVHGYTQILKEDFASMQDEERMRVMSNIMTNARKMGQLIDDLLTFSRLGRKELVKINVPMFEMVTNLCNEVQLEQENDMVEFKINPLHTAAGDSIVIKQVWLNLISNAVKYSSLKGKAIIEIGSEINGNWIDYYIKDNGVGFDMRYANKLFGVFQRLHTNEKFDGTGVGLAIVHRIISKHGGKVWAEGKVNEGATFHFSLPKYS